MPMQLTVTRNRKTSENYNSEGYGVSLTVELDQGLLTRPTDLQDRIAALYREADIALDQQRDASHSGQDPRDGEARPNGSSRSNGNGQSRDSSRGNGNGHGNGRSRRQHDTRATRAQHNAIQAIARQLGLEAEVECYDQLKVGLDELTVRQASTLIDALKAMQAGEAEPAENGGGR